MRQTGRAIYVGVSLTVCLALVACSASGAATPSPTPIPPDAPVASPPDGGGINPGLPQPQFVSPKPGQLATHPVSVAAMTPTVDGHNVKIRADWVSGVEPCNVLDRVEVGQNGTTFTIGLFEGSSDLNVACIEIAAYKATLIDLGELEPGSYVVQSADGNAPPASFTVE